MPVKLPFPKVLRFFFTVVTAVSVVTVVTKNIWQNIFLGPVGFGKVG